MICSIFTLAAQHLNLALRRKFLPFKSCWAGGHFLLEKLKMPAIHFPTSLAGRHGQLSRNFNWKAVTQEWRGSEGMLFCQMRAGCYLGPLFQPQGAGVWVFRLSLGTTQHPLNKFLSGLNRPHFSCLVGIQECLLCTSFWENNNKSKVLCFHSR